MARKSFKYEPTEQTDKKAETVNETKGSGIVVVAFNGSWTFHSVRYEGIHEWPENDERLTHAQGLYKIIGRK